jgi:hypothetical protein
VTSISLKKQHDVILMSKRHVQVTSKWYQTNKQLLNFDVS